MDTSADDLGVVKLIPNEMTMNEEKDLTLFNIESWGLEFTDTTREEEGVCLRLNLKRKVTNELLTTFLPSFLLMIITFATTFFKPFFFEAALGVNLTTMLMMTTISIGKMQTLPTTAYIRMIDVWLVFCQLVPFTEVILLTAQEYHRDEDQAGPVIAGSGRTKPAPRSLQVEDGNISSTIGAYGDKAGETKLQSPLNNKLQWFRTLGTSKIEKRISQRHILIVSIFQRKGSCQLLY